MRSMKNHEISNNKIEQERPGAVLLFKHSNMNENFSH